VAVAQAIVQQQDFRGTWPKGGGLETVKVSTGSHKAGDIFAEAFLLSETF
jgi:hypothetical protein